MFFVAQFFFAKCVFQWPKTVRSSRNFILFYFGRKNSDKAVLRGRKICRRTRSLRPQVLNDAPVAEDETGNRKQRFGFGFPEADRTLENGVGFRQKFRPRWRWDWPVSETCWSDRLVCVPGYKVHFKIKKGLKGDSLPVHSGLVEQPWSLYCYSVLTVATFFKWEEMRVEGR